MEVFAKVFLVLIVLIFLIFLLWVLSPIILFIGVFIWCVLKGIAGILKRVFKRKTGSA
jgi:hypothetical protein